MSRWTHIAASIDVDTFIEDVNIKSVVEEALKNAPEITGSERSADVFVNVLSGYNNWISCDCEHCQYYSTVQYDKDNSFTCKASNNFECPEGEYQTRVVITIIGDLRDRRKWQTQHEYNKFVKFITNDLDYDIRNVSVSIIDN